MDLAVVSYPNIESKDFNLIQSIRTNHDPQYQLVDPHFTLVFPSSVENQKEFAMHIEKMVQETKKIYFSIRKALTSKDTLTKNTYLFLITDKGSENIRELHNKLYTGLLSSKLRKDVLFIPHITIGNEADPDKLLNLEKNLNSMGICIEGTLDFLDIVNIKKGKPVNTITRIVLKG